MNNLYKILPIEDINPEWFGNVVVQQNLENCRKSNDGSKVLLKIPVHIQGIEDVPDEHKALFEQFEPYLTHEEVREELNKPDWITEI